MSEENSENAGENLENNGPMDFFQGIQFQPLSPTERLFWYIQRFGGGPRDYYMDVDGGGHDSEEMDVDLDDGASSSSAASFVRFSYKRPKVRSSVSHRGSKGTNYCRPVFEGGSSANMPDNGGSLNNGEETYGVSSEAEDLEVSMDLSDDLLHLVFSFLGHMDLCRASRVCRQWRTASSHEDFWRNLNFKNKRITVQQFEDICRRYPNASSVNIYGTPVVHSLVIKAVSLLRNLEVLSLGKGQLKNSTFEVLAESHTLRSLTINGATFASGVQEIPIHHERLHFLHILKCRVTRVSIRCPQLVTLSLRRSSMPQLVLDSPLLRELDLASCHKLADTTIRSTAISCPLLESFNMANCSCVTNETLREIAFACPNLHLLDASYCLNITLESVRLPMLTVLKLHSCEGITSASMTAISHSSMLETLELDNCYLLTSVSLDLPRLENIRLVHCRKFANFNVRSGNLSSVTVSNCPSLQRINITSNMLKKLVLQKLESLTTLGLQCPCLQEVDLTDCEALTNSVCRVFNDGGGCPVLKSLVLDNCESLTSVWISSSSLMNLSLAGCLAITSLALKCPFLEQVSLDGCDRLEMASFCPVALGSLNLGICPKLSELKVEAPQMASLDLKGCGLLSEASIRCPRLTSLDASFCSSQLKDDCLTDTASSCPRVQSLILMSCPSVGSAGLVSLQCLSSLTYLDLSYTFLVDLQPIFYSCTRLQVLKLQACKYLSDVSLEPLYKEGALPGLCELDLSYGTMSRMAIEKLLACCTHLTHLSVNGCKNMHDIDWDLRLDCGPEMLTGHDFHSSNYQPKHMLQHLNCVGCPNIRKVVIPSTAGCVYLCSLNFSLSTYLTEVNVACCDLTYLNLSNCPSLGILKLNCPRLTSLFLQSCNIGEEVVEDAISCCGMLETLDVRFCSKIYPTSTGRLRAACPSLKRIYTSQPSI